MSSPKSIATLRFAEELSHNLAARQPTIWITTDEPTRAARDVRELVQEITEQHAARRKERNQKDELNIYEWDLVNGITHIWSSHEGPIAVKPTSDEERAKFDPENPQIGVPVNWCNQQTLSRLASAPQTIARPPANNFDPTQPHQMILDIIGQMPPMSVIILHNFADLIDMARRVNHPASVNLMRNALYQLTGRFSMVSQVNPSLEDTGSIIVATGRLPDPEISRPEIMESFVVRKLERPDINDLIAITSAQLEQNGTDFRQSIIKASLPHYNAENEQQLFERCAQHLKGLTAFAARSAVNRVLVAKKSLDPRMLARERKSLIEQSPALTVIEPSPDFDPDRIKGMDNVFTLLDRSMSPSLPPKLRLNSTTMLGPPGTGKSAIAYATAQRLGWLLVKLNIGALMHSHIGKSEEHTRTALSILSALGNVVVFLDEVDKQTSGMISNNGERGDSGVSSRVMAEILTWEQERTNAPDGQRALIIRTANRARNMKTEQLRAGRNDMTFFVDLPAAPVRREILIQYLDDYAVKHDDALLKTLVARTRYWSGAELKELAKNIARFGEKDVESAFKFVRPVYDVDRDDINQLRKEGKDAGTPASSMCVDDDEKLEAQATAAETIASTRRRVVPGERLIA